MAAYEGEGLIRSHSIQQNQNCHFRLREAPTLGDCSGTDRLALFISKFLGGL
jgi:hypothetical protein